MAEWKILSHNSSEYVNEIKEPEDIGNVILFGSTGFLGIHVLKYLLDHTFKDIYCVIRPGADTAEKRLQNMLMYYFDAVNGLQTRIHIDPDWAVYLKENQEIGLST